MTTCRTQQCVPRYACQARNRAAEPDFEICRERKCPRRPRTTPKDLVLSVPLARRPGVKAGGPPRTVPTVRISLGFSAISKACWRCRQSRANPSLGAGRRIPCLTGKKQGISAKLGDMAGFSAESIRQISRLATNSLRIGTGNLIGVSGNFRDGTGNSGPDQANEIQPNRNFKSGARNCLNLLLLIKGVEIGPAAS